MNRPQIRFVTILCLGCAAALTAADDARPFGRTFGSGQQKVHLQIIAHRGSSADRPENTLASTRRAIETEATAVEVDVRTTSDGHLVLSHDATLDRTTNGTGPINALTLTEIKQLDAGSWFDSKYRHERVPTLAEVLRECRGKIDVLLDLKETGPDYAQRVADAVKTHGDPRRTIVGARSVERAQLFRRLLPDSRQLGLVGTPDEIELFAKAGVETIRIWPEWLAKDPTVVDRVRRCTAKLHLNGSTGATEEVAALLKHHPDSLSSDAPAKLIESLKQLVR